MRQSRIVCAALGVLAVVSCAFAGTTPAGTKFTYQGLLKSGGVPVNNNIDVRARLYDAEAGPDQVGSQIELLSVSCLNGVFTIPLDFGSSAFNGDARWLEIDVRSPAGSGIFTTLTPRQPITASPYSLQTRGIYVDDTGKVAIGATTGLLAKFQSLSTTFQLPAILGSNTDAIGGVGVLGASIGGTGIGVQAIAGSESGESTAILADNYSSEGTAIVANSLAEIGVAHGIRSIHRSTEGNAIHAISLNSEGATQTIRAENNSEEGKAIAGIALGGVGDINAQTAGVYGETHGARGIALYGYVPDVQDDDIFGTFTIAVYGRNDEPGGGYGVWGDSPHGVGVFGTAGQVGVAGLGTNAVDGVGVAGNGAIGIAGNGTRFGVQGEGADAGVHGKGSPIGVLGTASVIGGVGIKGITNAGFGNTAYGVWGESQGWDFWAAGTGGSYGSDSSLRWKRNIEPMADALAMLAEIRGVYFDWDAKHGGGHDIGCIAEEVGKVLPEIVAYEGNGIDAIGMDYSKLTPLLVEAVKALRAEKDSEIEALRAEKDAEIESLQLRLARLEAIVQELSDDRRRD